MLFGTNSMIKSATLPRLTLRNDTIQLVTNYTYRYLGVKLDNKLNYELFKKEIARQTAHKIYLMSKIRKYISCHQAVTMYKTKILPYFDYGDILYMGTNQQTISKLQKLQNRALRLCLNETPYSSIAYLHKSTKTDHLAHRRNSHLLNFAYQRKNNPKFIRVPRRETRLFGSVVLNTTTAKGNALVTRWNALLTRYWNKKHTYL